MLRLHLLLRFTSLFFPPIAFYLLSSFGSLLTIVPKKNRFFGWLWRVYATKYTSFTLYLFLLLFCASFQVFNQNWFEPNKQQTTTNERKTDHDKNKVFFRENIEMTFFEVIFVWERVIASENVVQLAPFFPVFFECPLYRFQLILVTPVTAI